MSLSLLFVSTLTLAMVAAPGVDGVVSVEAPDALAKSRAGEVVFVDIRRPEEWRATGMAEGTLGITLQDPEFLEKMAAAVNGDPDRAVVLICRTGTRTAQAASMLRVSGFRNVSHVGEGMIGSAHGPGWLARGLPTREVIE